MVIKQNFILKKIINRFLLPSLKYVIKNVLLSMNTLPTDSPECRIIKPAGPTNRWIIGIVLYCSYKNQAIR